MTNNATRPTRIALRGSRAVAAVSAIAPIATLTAYPEISRPAAASDTAKLDATCGSSPAIRNSVRPVPNPPSASAISPLGIPRSPIAGPGCFPSVTSASTGTSAVSAP
jgi:hypothetical protein